MAQLEISRSLDLDRIVLASRFISCARKSNFLPMLPPATSVFFVVSMWPVSYTHLDVYKRQFGDNLNDIEMLESAGTSYAVSNAREEVIAAAKRTCAPYWENGVLQVLKTFL